MNNFFRSPGRRYVDLDNLVVIEFSFKQVAESGGAARALPGLVAASRWRRGSPHIRTGNRAYL